MESCSDKAGNGQAPPVFSLFLGSGCWVFFQGKRYRWTKTGSG